MRCRCIALGKLESQLSLSRWLPRYDATELGPMGTFPGKYVGNWSKIWLINGWKSENLLGQVLRNLADVFISWSYKNGYARIAKILIFSSGNTTWNVQTFDFPPFLNIQCGAAGQKVSQFLQIAFVVPSHEHIYLPSFVTIVPVDSLIFVRLCENVLLLGLFSHRWVPANDPSLKTRHSGLQHRQKIRRK